MSDKLDLNKNYYKWNIKSGDYKPEIDSSYNKYQKRQRVFKGVFAVIALVILVSTIIVFLATR